MNSRVEQVRITYSGMETEELLSRVKSGTLTDEAHALALEELQTRGTNTAELPQEPPAIAEADEAQRSPMPNWVRKGMKWYGLFAYMFLFKMLGGHAGGLTIFLEMGAGYYFAVWWIVNTQARPKPLDAGVTVVGFLFFHACLAVVIDLAMLLLLRTMSGGH